jgi:hypothetical protein
MEAYFVVFSKGVFETAFEGFIFFGEFLLIEDGDFGC